MPEQKQRLVVVAVRGERRAVASGRFAKGELIAEFAGRVVHQPTRHTVQIGENEHLDDAGESESVVLKRYPWRYLNHSCDPNACIRGRRLFALRAIKDGDEVTFDYNTTEYEMAEPFNCRCGSSRCAGTVSGYKSLAEADRARIADSVATHVLRMLETEVRAAAT